MMLECIVGFKGLIHRRRWASITPELFLCLMFVVLFRLPALEYPEYPAHILHIAPTVLFAMVVIHLLLRR